MITIHTIENPAWYIYRANLVSKGLKPRKDWKPTKEWSNKVLLSQHSTIEQIQIYIYDDACRGDVASHIVRATKGHPRFVVQSMRPDWTGKYRPPAEYPRMFLVTCSPYALIEIARQRLCTHAASYTREWIERVKAELTANDDVFLSTLGEYLMPDCEYRGRCCMEKPCGRFKG